MNGSSENALPPSWTTIPLHLAGSWVGGGTPSKSNPSFWGGDIPWISPNDMKFSTIIRTEEMITEAGLAGSSTKLIPSYAVVVVVRSGILRRTFPVAVTAIEATLNQDLKALVTHQGVEPKYVYYALKCFEHRVLNDCSKQGVTVESIEMPRLLAFSIPLAPFPEQHRIVAEIEKHLTRLDAAVGALQRLRANLKRYRASVLKAAVEGKLVPCAGDSPNETFQQEAAAACVNLKGSQGLPAGWAWTTVGDLATVGTGATPLRANAAYYGGDIPWVTSGALNQPFVDSAEEFISPLALKETNAKVFPAGTVLVAMYGEGKTRGKASELRIEAATNQACAALLFRPETERMKAFVKVFLAKHYEDLRLQSSGGVQPNLNLSIIKAIEIPLPPKQQRQQIVAEVDRRFSIVEELESVIDHSLVRAERLRQSVLKRAFEGQLVPQDPDDEPASVLLERIHLERHKDPAFIKARARKARKERVQLSLI